MEEVEGGDDPLASIAEVGEEFGVTRERVRQIESKRLAKLGRKDGGGGGDGTAVRDSGDLSRPHGLARVQMELDSYN